MSGGPSRPTILDRQTLYELVWSKPTAYLAQEYGISDVALGKMCQGVNIPKLPRGYWAKAGRSRHSGADPASRPPSVGRPNRRGAEKSRSPTEMGSCSRTATAL